MPANRISFKKIRGIFNLIQQGEINYRRAAKILKISRATLKKYISDIRSYRCFILKEGMISIIVWTDSAIEDLNAIGESLVELPEPKPKKKKKLEADIS